MRYRHSPLVTAVTARNVNSAKSMMRSVRAFLRFAFATGRTKVALWGAVPTPAGWHLATLPKALDSLDIERLLMVAGNGLFHPLCRRNYAVLLLLVRLGLRRGEVASLVLDDLDWHTGEVVITGKGDSVERLPLPLDVGEAIVGWLTDGRPQCETRALFTTQGSPVRPMTSGSVGHVVRTVCETAGIDPVGAHRLRHTLATEMLRAGASLPEVGQVLRHRSP